MIFSGFWNKLPLPIIGLSPMEGITDAAFRYMICKIKKPSVVFTEFCNVEGLARGETKKLVALRYHEREQPIVAQVFGVEKESYYKIALMLCFLGFDGIDINMGCPVNKVTRLGSGAGLILHPKHAKKLIRTVKQAAQDWTDGITLKEGNIHPKIINALKSMKRGRITRKQIPISIKTRIGIDKIIAEDWVKVLLEEQPALITMHGRTLKQMYSGQANWDVLAKVAKICKKADTLFLGNGDVQSIADAKEKIKTYGVDGVLVGRATLGNPWFFKGHEPTIKKRLQAAIDHSETFEKLLGDLPFSNIHKHLAWYCKGFDGARELRKELMQTNSSGEVEEIFDRFLNTKNSS